MDGYPPCVVINNTLGGSSRFRFLEDDFLEDDFLEDDFLEGDFLEDDFNGIVVYIYIYNK